MMTIGHGRHHRLRGTIPEGPKWTTASCATADASVSAMATKTSCCKAVGVPTRPTPRVWLAFFLAVTVICIAGCQTGRKRPSEPLQIENDPTPVGRSSSVDVDEATSASEPPFDNLPETPQSAQVNQSAVSDQATPAPRDCQSIGATDTKYVTEVKPTSFQSESPTDVKTPEPTDVLEHLPPPQDATTSDSPSDRPPEDASGSSAALRLEDVIRSVQRSYPLLITIALQRQITAGQQLAAQGAFDLKAKAFGIAAPEGFYQTYRNGVSLNQPLLNGGYWYGGYKIGDGNFEPWFKERETNEGGEFSMGVGLPLLRDRRIDQRRADLFIANQMRQQVEPAVRAQLLEFVRLASRNYWAWVAAGQTLDAQRRLLQNAAQRVDQIEQRVDAGDLERIVRINNDQLIAAREAKVIQSLRKLQETAIKLSLFLRTPDGSPIVPDESQLLGQFPPHHGPDATQMQSDITRAVASSPALAELQYTAEQYRIELRQAENMRLPQLDAQLLAAKDLGGDTNKKGDKGPFELEAGLYGEVPIQRRKARGKINSIRAKLAQLEAKRRFVINKITASVQDAFSALETSANRIQRAEQNVRLARETRRLGRIQFDAGNISLIELNIYEKSVTDAELLLVEAKAEYFFAQADYRAALSLDPLDRPPLARP